MKERIEIRLDKKDSDLVEKIRIEKGFEDRQDYIVDLLKSQIKKENKFFFKLLKLFK